MQAFYRLIRKTKTFLFKISMEDKLLFLEAFFLTGIMRFKILKKPFNKLKEEMGINATLINPRYITGLDKEMLEDIVYVAVNDVINQIKKEKEKKLGKYTNGLGGIL